MRKTVPRITTVVGIHDRKGLEAELGTSWSNFLKAADLPIPSRSAAAYFVSTCDLFILDLTPTMSSGLKSARQRHARLRRSNDEHAANSHVQKISYGSLQIFEGGTMTTLLQR